jgi:hypothetical protein
MASKSGKPVLKPGTSSVFVGGRSDRSVIGWRLDVREEGGRTQTFRKRHRPGGARPAEAFPLHFSGGVCSSCGARRLTISRSAGSVRFGCFWA